MPHSDRSALTLREQIAQTEQVDFTIQGAAKSAAWQDDIEVSALSDSERHLGHIFWDGDAWVAYDAVHPSPSSDGFLCLGRFRSVNEAKEVIEKSVGVLRRPVLCQKGLSFTEEIFGLVPV